MWELFGDIVVLVLFNIEGEFLKRGMFIVE